MNAANRNKKWKAVFFDADGVLLDSLQPHLDFCRDQAAKRNLRILVPDKTQFRHLVARGAKANPMREFLRTVGFSGTDLDRAEADYKTDFARSYPVEPFPSTNRTLATLKKTGVKLGLVTSNIRENVERALGKAMNHFDNKLLFYGVRKADALFKGIATLSGVKKYDPEASEEYAFIGDVPTDAAAALEAGVAFLGITDDGWGLVDGERGWGIVPGADYVTIKHAADILTGLDTAHCIDLPFKSRRSGLYTVKELWDGYHPDMTRNYSLDAKIYRYFQNGSKYRPRRDEIKAQRTHDGEIERAIDDLLGVNHESFPKEKKPVMILGSHSRYRRDIWYTRAAFLTYELARAGFFVATGGGPGLMEAANLGAYMSEFTKADLNDALETLRASQEPATDDKRKQYEMPDYWDKSQAVVEKYPNGAESLGVPTWFYGHEGANAFASHVAKFFSNGLRESKMTSIGFYGAIFAPGGPGTSQEVFTDAAENTYHSFQWLSPMVFFNEPDDDIVTKMLEILRKQTSADYRAQDMYLRSTDPQQIAQFLLDRLPQFRPMKF